MQRKLRLRSCIRKLNSVFDLTIDKLGQDTPSQKSWLRYWHTSQLCRFYIPISTCFVKWLVCRLYLFAYLTAEWDNTILATAMSVHWAMSIYTDRSNSLCDVQHRPNNLINREIQYWQRHFADRVIDQSTLTRSWLVLSTIRHTSAVLYYPSQIWLISVT